MACAPIPWRAGLACRAAAIERIAAESRSVSPDTALRLARLYDTTPLYWLQMQAAYDLAVAGKAVARDIEKIAPIRTAA